MSPDGMYYWDGQRWASTLSPDGRFRWNGAAWEPVQSSALAPGFYPAPRTVREATSWTQPLQLVVIIRYVLTGIYGLLLPFWATGYVTQAMQQSIERQRQTYPPGAGPPPGFTDLMTSVMTTSLWIGVIISVLISVVAVVAAARRWVWAYYVILVLLGLTLFSTVINLINLVSGGALTANQVQPPEAARIATYVSGVVDAALFVWMLVALVKRGPWAMRKVS
ncbi:MAG TPA: hypothetical protein VGX27_04805 [Candidatus Dormibacteraeota bacterium]|nr:hypothetical protein [Candidatus Dormibacteraeota bacterium]